MKKYKKEPIKGEVERKEVNLCVAQQGSTLGGRRSERDVQLPAELFKLRAYVLQE